MTTCTILGHMPGIFVYLSQIKLMQMSWCNVYVPSTLKSMGIENLLQIECFFSARELPPLVGCSTDCASVNVSDHNGMQGMLQAAIAWCYSHRLELAYILFPVISYLKKMI